MPYEIDFLSGSLVAGKFGLVPGQRPGTSMSKAHGRNRQTFRSNKLDRKDFASPHGDFGDQSRAIDLLARKSRGKREIFALCVERIRSTHVKRGEPFAARIFENLELGPSYKFSKIIAVKGFSLALACDAKKATVRG